ncbi:MAG TPA: hypothetical protein VGF94_01135 [Kofleriaceae bacterium]|jgi:hypothetical protein
MIASRRALLTELAACTVVVAALSVYALWKMDYLGAATAEQVRMTDSSRTAYVAKNIVDGRGYTTNELPAFLVDFYDHSGKLHTDRWPNADRFPLTAYAVAALYVVTRSTSYEVGILGYNLVCFVAFIVLLYWLARVVWNDRWAALCTIGIALLHPLTYTYLYLKDADTMLLTLGVMAAFLGYFRRPADELSRKRALAIGTMLAWSLLARPNIGLAFIAYFALLVTKRLWTLRRTHGVKTALAMVSRREGVAVVAIALWCLPFVIHSLSEWGSLMFSASSRYQMPLGTRYAMDTDTWWKYSEPGHPITLGLLAHTVPSELVAKFTTSWWPTIAAVTHSYLLELVLGCSVFVWLGSRASAHEQAFRRVVWMVAFALLLNFLVLPLYCYQDYNYRYYLSFGLPLFWIASGQAVVLVVGKIRPVLASVYRHILTKPSVWLAVAIAAIVAWNIGYSTQDSNQLIAATARVAKQHPLPFAFGVALILLYRPLSRLPISRLPWRSFGLASLAVLALVIVRYAPRRETKQLDLNWFPVDDGVWDVLRERKGLVLSFALQGEVNWTTDRQDIPAPEFPMHVYSLMFDHGLEAEDVYIESAETQLGQFGAFRWAAPGFEGYARLEKFQGRLPGYEIAFHRAAMKGYPKYRVAPRPKASTIYRLVDRGAVQAMARSPRTLELGDVANVIYTAQGWGDYVMLGDKPAVAATAITRERYLQDLPERPWEDTAVTFFLDDDRPTAFDLEIYATHATILAFYWNLDLYAYDPPEDRAAHAIGTYAVTKLGWQHVHLEIPSGVTRKGFNKLGFRSLSFAPAVICPPELADAACRLESPAPLPGITTDGPPLVVHARDATTASPMFVSVFAGVLAFEYAR